MISILTWRRCERVVAVSAALAVVTGVAIGLGSADTSRAPSSASLAAVQADAPPAATTSTPAGRVPAPGTTETGAASTPSGATGTSKAPASSGVTTAPGVTTIAPTDGKTLTGKIVNGRLVAGLLAGLTPVGPAAPAAINLRTTAGSVTVSWQDGAASNATDETGFTVYKRNNSGAWTAVHTVARNTAPTADKYSWADTATDVSAQCYLVGSDTAIGSAFTVEQCTVRPDPSAFPQTASVPSSTIKWSGLSSVDDGLGTLYNQDIDSDLGTQHQTFGVSVGWDQSAQNNVKLERPGASPEPLMYGEAVAIRVWGAGWLAYGHQTWGVDLHLSDTPAYEWYVVGLGTPGTTVGNEFYALWNKSTGDFLVHGSQTWGVDLDWYKKTQPQTPPPPATNTTGVKTFEIYNCISDEHAVEVWVRDNSAGTDWSDKGQLQSQWDSEGSCPSGAPYTFTPISGHSYIVETVDFSADGCSNDPSVGCEASTTTFIGNSNGGVAAS